MVKGRNWKDDYVLVDCKNEEIKYSIKKGNEEERPMSREEIREFLINIL